MNIFPEDQVDENFFDLYYHPFKKQIWGFGAVFGIAVVSFLGYREIRQQRLDDEWSQYEEAMKLRTLSLPGQADPEQVERQVAALREIISGYPDEPVAAFALKGVVQAQIAAGDYDAALASLTELQQSFPDFPLNTLPAGATDGTRSLADHLRATIDSEKGWESSTQYVHPAPSSDRTAIIDTSLGSFQLGFYAEDAPEHVAAFVERAKRGDYNGTQIYEVRVDTDGSPMLLRAGSRASKTERDPADHDRDDPTDTIEPEDSRFTIRHVFGVVSSVEMDSGESATSFQVVTAPDGLPNLDGRSSIFAAVLDREGSLQTLDRLATAPTYGTNPETAKSDSVFRMREHPYPRVLIRRVAILTNEKVEDGHSWDTSRIGTDQPEPWEADLAPAPLPEEFDVPKEDGDERAPGDGAPPEENGADEPDSNEETGNDGE